MEFEFVYKLEFFYKVTILILSLITKDLELVMMSFLYIVL